MKKEIQDRIEICREVMRECSLCPRRCGVDRIAGEKGYCGLDSGLRLFREMVHNGEEEGLNPSHQIYFAGCNLRCEHCSLFEWNEQPDAADVVDVDWLAERIAQRQAEGAKTVNLLGGEPAVSVYGILELLGRIDAASRVVWNSNMYYSRVVGDLLSGLVNVFLADLKCGSDCCGDMLGADDYTETARKRILDEVGRADVIVRHLVLPGHFECCVEPTLNWIADKAGSVRVSIRGDYVPPVETVAAPKGYLEKKEYDRAIILAKELNLNLI